MRIVKVDRNAPPQLYEQVAAEIRRATGNSFGVQLIDIIRFGDDGLAHERWGVFDALAMMQQLGAIPKDPSA